MTTHSVLAAEHSTAKITPTPSTLEAVSELARGLVARSDWYFNGHGRRRFAVLFLVYALLIAGVFYFSYSLGWDFEVPDNFSTQRMMLLLPVVACKLLMLYSFGQFRSVLSYFGLADFGGVCGAMGTVFVAMLALYYGAEPLATPPRNAIIIDALLSIALISAFRLSLRVAHTWVATDRRLLVENKRRLVIVGANDLGAEIAKDLLQRPGSGLQPVFFVDSDAHRIGLSIHGLPVFGPLERLLQLGPAARVTELIVAFNPTSPGHLYQIVEIGRQIGASTQVVPSLQQLASGEVNFHISRGTAPVPAGVPPKSREVPAATSARPVSMGKPPRIFLSPPHLGAAEFAYIEEAFRTNWVAPVGPNIDAFEKEFCEHFGFRHAAALSSGTAALHLALRMIGVKRGDEVACSTLTFAASANPIVYEGAHPVLVDSEAGTWNMDPALLADWLDRRARAGRLPRAVIAVELYGQCAGVEKIAAICAHHRVSLIEDAAEALGATSLGRPAGSFGRLGIFSFNGNKIITTSGGGMLVSDDPALIAEARFLATQARDPAPHYQHSRVGFNYRLSNVLAGIGRGQLQVLDRRIAARRRIFSRYFAALGDLPGVHFMPEAPDSRSNRWLSCLTIDPAVAGGSAGAVLQALGDDNIEARPVWKPLHLQPVFASAEVLGGGVAERLFAHGVCLPSGSAMSDDEIDRVIAVVRKTLGATTS